MSRKKLIDAKDVEILNILQTDARISNKDLASKIGLSESSTKTRVDNLVKNQVIVNASVELDLSKFNYSFLSLVEFVPQEKFLDEFMKHLLNLKSVMTVYTYQRNEPDLGISKLRYIHVTLAHKTKSDFLAEMKGFLEGFEFQVEFRIYELSEITKAFPTIDLSLE